jgi:hypothetical protein
MGFDLDEGNQDDRSTSWQPLPPFSRDHGFPRSPAETLVSGTKPVKCLRSFYRPLIPKPNADPASATDIPKKNPLGAGAA